MSAPTVISLGYRCEVAYQIRAMFGVEAAMPFDWLYTPLASIPLMLDEGFQHMADPRWLEPFEEIRLGRRFVTIINRRYQVVLPHDFPETAEHSVVSEWRDHIPKAASKWAHLAERWRETMAAGGPIVFIRRGGDLRLENFQEGVVRRAPLEPLGPGETLHDAMLSIYRNNDEALQPTSVQAYLDLLNTLRTAAPDCRLLVAEPGCDLAGSDILTASVGLPAPGDWPNPLDYWKGPTSAWRQALARIHGGSC